MNLTDLETGLTQVLLKGVRQDDGTINLGKGGSGANIASWPDTLVLADASTLQLTNVPGPNSVEQGERLEFAWYER